MKNIAIPETAVSYEADLLRRAFPDPQITDNDFYRRLIGWVIDERTPLLYEPSHPDERDNLSINFNWLALRDYEDTTLGPPPTIHTLYALHEFVHMTHWLPTRLGDISPKQYAEQFTGSEYRASNESEILAYYRMPELRARVFPGMRIAFDVMRARGIEQPSSRLLGQVRALFVEHDDFDHLVGDDYEAREVLTRLKQFSGNREWSQAHATTIRAAFLDASLPQSDGLTDGEYEQVIAGYEPCLSQDQYETNVIRNVRFAYAMCGLEVPLLTSFNAAVLAAGELEGRHALVRS